MEELKTDLVILSDGERPPIGTTSPPRKPKWTDTFAYVMDPEQFCKGNLERHGPIFKTLVFGGITIFVGTSRANQLAFSGDSTYTEISLPATTMEMFGEYSLFQKPELHRQRKNALRPGFTGQMLAGYLPYMHRVIGQQVQKWSTTTPVRLFPAVETISFDVLAPLLLGINLAPDTLVFDGSPVASKTELQRLYKNFFDGFYGLVKWRSPLTAFGRGQEARQQLIAFMRFVIQQRRAKFIEPTADFLSMMLAQQQDSPQGVFSEAFIENQCLLQLWASHYEVVALVTSWIYQIGQYPEVLKRLRLEQTAVLSPISHLEEVGLEALKQMSFLESTIKETLRLLPPTPTATRRLTKSVVLDGILYEKGWGLTAEPRIAHKLEENFTNPEIFDPERFLPERDKSSPYEFIAFGGGVHAYLGAQLAIAMAKVFAIHLLSNFEWQSSGQAEFVQFPLKKIKNNYLMQFSQASAK